MIRFWLSVGIAASLFAGPASAQQGNQGYSQRELTTILNSEGAPKYTADELSAILTPLRTRSLSAGSGIEEGSPGSGVVPDLEVHFEFDSATLTPRAMAQLDELGRALQSDILKPYRFQVSGHTDAVGADWYNEDLSRRRANSVAAYLQERHGISDSRLEALGLGETALANPADPGSDANRRVEIKTMR